MSGLADALQQEGELETPTDQLECLRSVWRTAGVDARHRACLLAQSRQTIAAIRLSLTIKAHLILCAGRAYTP
jgi:hypothetical protein